MTYALISLESTSISIQSKDNIDDMLVYLVYSILFAQIFSSFLILAKNLLAKYHHFRIRNTVIPISALSETIEMAQVFTKKDLGD